MYRSHSRIVSASSDGCLAPGWFLAAYVEAARSLDLEPYRHLRQAGLPARGFEDERVYVPHDRFMDLLRDSARAARRPDFALEVARSLDLRAFGAVGILASALPTLRDALIVLTQHSRHPQRKMYAQLQLHADRGVIRLTPNELAPLACIEARVIAMGVTLRAGQSLIGADWRPRLTTFSHPAPRDVAPYQALFGDVLFGQPFDAITVDGQDLARPIPTANDALARLASAHLETIADRREAPFQDQVQELITVLLPKGLCTVERVAAQLGVDRRTVHRRLGELGVSFSDLVQRRRIAAVEKAVRQLPLAELSRELGFSSVSTFSRWFRQNYGVTASRFRRAA
jgi:AraC-like DNA-binding protein